MYQVVEIQRKINFNFKRNLVQARGLLEWALDTAGLELRWTNPHGYIVTIWTTREERFPMWMRNSAPNDIYHKEVSMWNVTRDDITFEQSSVQKYQEYGVKVNHIKVEKWFDDIEKYKAVCDVFIKEPEPYF
jgi:hypothetical protein